MKKLTATISLLILSLILIGCSPAVEESAIDIVDADPLVATLSEAEGALAQAEAAIVNADIEIPEEGVLTRVEPVPVQQVQVEANPNKAPVSSVALQSEASVPTALQPLVEKIVADAALQSGVDAALVGVVSAESVTWSDSSLGCPQPDMFYAMALVEGYKVVVKADGQLLSYHVGNDNFVQCEVAAQ